MPIHRPGRVLMRNIPLRFVSNKVAGGGSKPITADLPLTAIIDLMICMVVFLLMSFSSSGDLMAQKPSIKMPMAQHGRALTVAPTLAVDSAVVTLDGKRVADTASLAAAPKIERIEPLIQELERIKRTWTMLHPRDHFPGQLVFQADVGIDYRVIKKLMFSAAQAGYADLSFAVNHSGER